MVMEDRTSLVRVTYCLGPGFERPRPFGMNSFNMSSEILFLDRSPADRTVLGLQCYPSIRSESPKNLSAKLLPLIPCPETSSPKGLLAHQSTPLMLYEYERSAEGLHEFNLDKNVVRGSNPHQPFQKSLVRVHID